MAEAEPPANARERIVQTSERVCSLFADTRGFSIHWNYDIIREIDLVDGDEKA